MYRPARPNFRLPTSTEGPVSTRNWTPAAVDSTGFPRVHAGVIGVCMTLVQSAGYSPGRLNVLLCSQRATLQVVSTFFSHRSPTGLFQLRPGHKSIHVPRNCRRSRSSLLNFSVMLVSDLFISKHPGNHPIPFGTAHLRLPETVFPRIQAKSAVAMPLCNIPLLLCLLSSSITQGSDRSD